MKGSIAPLTIRIDRAGELPISPARVKYGLRTLVELAGYPCHFVGKDYSGKVDIEYGRGGAARSVLTIHPDPFPNPSRNQPAGFRREEDTEFVLWPGEDPSERIIIRRGGETIARNDIVLTTFYFLSGAHDRTIPRNKIGDQLSESSFLYRQKLLHIPIVNKYARFIARIFPGRPRIELWPDNKRYAAVFTHDVDYPEILRWVEVIRTLARPGRGSLRPAGRIIRGKVDYWCFRQWMELESAAGVRSAFFFSGIQNCLFHHVIGAPDPFYDISREKYKILLKDLNKAGFEVGLHASYNSWRSEEQLHAEKTRVEESLGTEVISNRQHYWQSDPEGIFRTVRLYHRVGILCDTTIGFERRCGFRFGISAPFQLLDLDTDQVIPVVELPTTVMDDQLFGYRELSYLGPPREEIDELLDQVSGNNGLLVVNFHGRVLDETMFPGWRQACEHILARTAGDSDCWCPLPREVAAHFLRRQTTLDAHFVDDDR